MIQDFFTGLPGEDRMEKPKRKRIVFFVGKVVIFVFPVLFFLGAELVARLFRLDERISASLSIPEWVDQDRLARKMILSDMASRPQDLRLFYSAYRWDRYLFYTMKPNLKIPMVDILQGTWRNDLKWSLDTNERGYRGRAYPVEKPEGVFRIICMGDSSTYGWGLDTQETYAACLQKLLDKLYGAGKFQVLNFGMPGYTTFQGYILLQREVMSYQPDVVCLAFGANDDSPVALTSRERYERACSWVGTLQELFSHSKAYGVLKGLILKTFHKTPEARFEEAGKRAAAGKKVDVPVEEYRDLLKDMAATLRGTGCDVIFIAQCLSRRPRSRIHILKQIADEERIPYLDIYTLYPSYTRKVEEDPQLSQLLRKYVGIYGEEALNKNPRLYFLLPDMCHPNALLNELVAMQLEEIMRERFPGFDSRATYAMPGSRQTSTISFCQNLRRTCIDGGI